MDQKPESLLPTWYQGVSDVGSGKSHPFWISVSSSEAWKHLEVSSLSRFYDSKEGPWENWDPHTEWPPGRQARRCLPDDPLEIGNNAFLLLCFPRILMDHQVSNQDRWNVPKWVIFNLPPFFSLVQFSSAEIASYSVVCRKESTVVLSPGFNLGSTLL